MLVYCRVTETICDTTDNMSPSNDRQRETVYLVAKKSSDARDPCWSLAAEHCTHCFCIQRMLAGQKGTVWQILAWSISRTELLNVYMSKLLILRMVIPPVIGNPYSGYINPMLLGWWPSPSRPICLEHVCKWDRAATVQPFRHDSNFRDYYCYELHEDQ